MFSIGFTFYYPSNGAMLTPYLDKFKHEDGYIYAVGWLYFELYFSRDTQ